VEAGADCEQAASRVPYKKSFPFSNLRRCLCLGESSSLIEFCNRVPCGCWSTRRFCFWSGKWTSDVCCPNADAVSDACGCPAAIARSSSPTLSCHSFDGLDGLSNWAPLQRTILTASKLNQSLDCPVYCHHRRPSR
jgi:hypothetical protein